MDWKTGGGGSWYDQTDEHEAYERSLLVHPELYTTDSRYRDIPAYVANSTHYGRLPRYALGAYSIDIVTNKAGARTHITVTNIFDLQRRAFDAGIWRGCTNEFPSEVFHGWEIFYNMGASLPPRGCVYDLQPFVFKKPSKQ